jgi:hypothetical protein
MMTKEKKKEKIRLATSAVEASDATAWKYMSATRPRRSDMTNLSDCCVVDREHNAIGEICVCSS